MHGTPKEAFTSKAVFFVIMIIQYRYINIPPPREYMTLQLVAELEYPSDPESYANGSLATGRASHVGQVEGERADEEVLQKRISTATTVTTFPC